MLMINVFLRTSPVLSQSSVTHSPNQHGFLPGIKFLYLQVETLCFFLQNYKEQIITVSDSAPNPIEPCSHCSLVDTAVHQLTFQKQPEINPVLRGLKLKLAEHPFVSQSTGTIMKRLLAVCVTLPANQGQQALRSSLWPAGRAFAQSPGNLEIHPMGQQLSPFQNL